MEYELFEKSTFSAADFLTECEGKALKTAAIQKAIDSAFLAGGGTAVVPEGVYPVGTIRLRSNVRLLLKSGAILEGSREPEDYYVSDDALEPYDPSWERVDKWLPPAERTGEYNMLHSPLSRWHRGLIKAINAENISIIGEEGSFIDGRDCFDEKGEEHYRGPHAINLNFCKDVEFKGYSIRNSANWAHSIWFSENIHLDNIKVYGGHDGAHFKGCKNILVENSEFYTGDDCVAGFADVDFEVRNCVLNTACSAFRIGGTHLRFHDCKVFAPAKYVFRGSLSDEEKRNHVPSSPKKRYNMLSLFTYYADNSVEIPVQPGDILLENMTVDGADRFLHYNYSGNETWQRACPLASISFRNIEAKDILLPLNIYGDEKTPITATFENCSLAFKEEGRRGARVHAAYAEKLIFKNVKVTGRDDEPFVKCFKPCGEFIFENADIKGEKRVETDEEFVATPI